MEKNGLLDNFVIQAHADWFARISLLESEEHKILENILQKSLMSLKVIGSSKDIHTILESERISLELELIHYSNSSEERNSIKQALEQISESRNSLSIVIDSASYLSATATYPGKRKENGLPIDSFREFLKSHATRLTNRLAAPLSVPEKNILRQRKENLRVAKELYMELQRKALGLPTQSKDQGLAR